MWVGGHLACRLRARLGDPASVSLSLYWFLSELWAPEVLLTERGSGCFSSPWHFTLAALCALPPFPAMERRTCRGGREPVAIWTSSLPPTLFFFTSYLQNKMENKEERIQKSVLCLKGFHENDYTSFLVKSTITCTLCNVHIFHMLKAWLCVIVWFCGQSVGAVWRWRRWRGVVGSFGHSNSIHGAQSGVLTPCPFGTMEPS